MRGYRIAFDSEDHLSAFMTEAKRTALPVARERGDEEHPALAYVHESFPFADYGMEQ